MDKNQKPNLEKIKTDEIEAKLKNYTSPEGLSTKELERGLWYVEHRQKLKIGLMVFLALAAAISWSYTIYGFAYYFTRGLSQDEQLTKELVETNGVGHDYILQISAKNFSVSPVKILRSASNKYDFYVRLNNDNQRWWAEFDYYFTAGGQQTPKTEGFILPSSSEDLMALAQEFTYEPSFAQLIIDNIRWHRLDQHKIPDWSVYYKSRMNIASADIKFTPANSSPLSEKLNLNELNFQVINHSAYNFWQVGFAVLLYGGSSLADVNHYTLDNFMSGQERSVSLSWPGNIGQIDRVEIVPEINIMRDDIYIPFEGGVGQEK